MRNRGRIGRRRGLCGKAGALSVPVVLLIVSLFAPMAQAQISDSFAAQGEWVSIDAFTTQAVKKAQEAQQAAPTVNDSKAQEKTRTADTPSRPLAYPVAPSRIAASSDPSEPNDHEAGLSEASTWTPIDEYDQRAQGQPKILGSGEGGFAIRYSTLPSPAVHSMPASRVGSSRLDLEAKSLAARQKKETIKEDKAKQANKDDLDSKACKAYADYKRQQLAEMESDRKTLAQLKQALSDLGLTDRLNFMMDSGQLLAEPKGALAQPEKASP